MTFNPTIGGTYLEDGSYVPPRAKRGRRSRSNTPSTSEEISEIIYPSISGMRKSVINKSILQLSSASSN